MTQASQHPPSEHQAFWQNRYVDGQTPWDLNGPSPHLQDLYALAAEPPGNIVVLGCGRGHDAHWFLNMGYVVTAMDYAPLAIEQARDLYGGEIEWHVADCLNLDTAWTGAFDYVFEHTFFCAIPPSQRRAYLKSVTELLKQGGHLIGIFWDFPAGEEGPPYPVTMDELKALFSLHFDILATQPVAVNAPFSDGQNRQGTEYLVVMQKK